MPPPPPPGPYMLSYALLKDALFHYSWAHAFDVMSHMNVGNLEVASTVFSNLIEIFDASYISYIFLYLCDTSYRSQKIKNWSKYNPFSVVDVTSFRSWDMCSWAMTIVKNCDFHMWTGECKIQLRNQNIYSPKFKQQIWHWTCNIKLITVIQLVLNCNKKWFYIESLIWKKNFLALA